MLPILVPLTGLIAGALHVISGPDHLAAVAPLSVATKHQAWRSGLTWGLGHSTGVGLVGLLAIALREAIPFQQLSQFSERLVGVMLIGIGIWTLRLALRVKVHQHSHTHDGEAHAHLHFHSTDHSHDDVSASASHRHGHAALGIGTLHGLAGSSHFLGVLPALAFPHWHHAVVYLLMFAIGTIVAMVGFSSAFGWLATRFLDQSRQAYRALMYATSACAFGVGLWWMWL